MSETWTEYAVRFTASDGVQKVTEPTNEIAAQDAADWLGTYASVTDATVVGRTVTASDWLPVQDQPTPPAGYVSPLPLHRTEANYGVVCGTCDGGGCPDCTDPA